MLNAGYVRRKILKDDAMIYSLLERNSIKGLVNEHLEGKVNRRLLIWSLINLEWWMANYLSQ